MHDWAGRVCCSVRRPAPVAQLEPRNVRRLPRAGAAAHAGPPQYIVALVGALGGATAKHNLPCCFSHVYVLTSFVASAVVAGRELLPCAHCVKQPLSISVCGLRNLPLAPPHQVCYMP